MLATQKLKLVKRISTLLRLPPKTFIDGLSDDNLWRSQICLNILGAQYHLYVDVIRRIAYCSGDRLLRQIVNWTSDFQKKPALCKRSLLMAFWLHDKPNCIPIYWFGGFKFRVQHALPFCFLTLIDIFAGIKSKHLSWRNLAALVSCKILLT